MAGTPMTLRSECRGCQEVDFDGDLPDVIHHHDGHHHHSHHHHPSPSTSHSHATHRHHHRHHRHSMTPTGRRSSAETDSQRLSRTEGKKPLGRSVWKQSTQEENLTIFGQKRSADSSALRRNALDQVNAIMAKIPETEGDDDSVDLEPELAKSTSSVSKQSYHSTASGGQEKVSSSRTGWFSRWFGPRKEYEYIRTIDDPKRTDYTYSYRKNPSPKVEVPRMCRPSIHGLVDYVTSSIFQGAKQAGEATEDREHQSLTSWFVSKFSQQQQPAEPGSTANRLCHQGSMNTSRLPPKHGPAGSDLHALSSDDDETEEITPGLKRRKRSANSDAYTGHTMVTRSRFRGGAVQQNQSAGYPTVAPSSRGRVYRAARYVSDSVTYGATESVRLFYTLLCWIVYVCSGKFIYDWATHRSVKSRQMNQDHLSPPDFFDASEDDFDYARDSGVEETAEESEPLQEKIVAPRHAGKKRQSHTGIGAAGGKTSNSPYGDLYQNQNKAIKRYLNMKRKAALGRTPDSDSLEWHMYYGPMHERRMIMRTMPPQVIKDDMDSYGDNLMPENSSYLPGSRGRGTNPKFARRRCSRKKAARFFWSRKSVQA